MSNDHDVQDLIWSPDRIHPENRRDPRVVVVDRDGEQLQWGELGAGSFGQVGDTTLSEHVLGKIEERVRAGENGGVVWVDGTEYVFVAGE